MKICPVCTNENPDTNKFCNFCGAQLSDVEPAESNGTEADPLSEIMAKMQSQEKTADPVRSGPVENNANPPAGPANYQPAQQGGYQPAGPNNYQQTRQGSGNMGRNNNNPQQYTYSPTPFDSKIPEVPIGGYIAWAVVDILFSLLFGILGLVFVLKINKSETPEEQQKNIKYAKIFLIIGSAIGVLNLVIMFISNSL